VVHDVTGTYRGPIRLLFARSRSTTCAGLRLRELLDPTVAGVGDVDETIGVDRDAVGIVGRREGLVGGEMSKPVPGSVIVNHEDRA
jgi:hypothetical protein